MRFGVIWSFDIPKDTSVRRYQPINVKAWTNTEGDSEFEYDYLGGCWEGGKHRKYLREMSREVFERFIDGQCLRASSTETMGSLGTPWGWHSPAVSFEDDASDIIMSCYVTPLPEHCDGPITDTSFDRLMSTIRSHYEDGAPYPFYQKPRSKRTLRRHKQELRESIARLRATLHEHHTVEYCSCADINEKWL